MNEAINGEPAEFVKSLVPIGDSTSDRGFRMPHLLCTIMPVITQKVFTGYDALK